MNKKLKAFTLIEVTITVTVIGLIALFAISTFVKSKSLEKGRIGALSKRFDMEIESVYQHILYKHTKNTSVETLLKQSGEEGDSQTLREYFVKYIGGDIIEGEIITPAEDPESPESPESPETPETPTEQTNTTCENLKIAAESEVSSYGPKAFCAEFPNKIIAGFYLDKECKQDIIAKEVYNRDNMETRAVTNACGYVIYGFKNGEGVLGEDLFVIPLGKRTVR